ncbi:hypothetical protein [Gardnerella vaginalis]|uniref:Uncharacterized protein n=1 Tax=Gardnerella vaginalis TaxID=2702 RepID=A0A2K1SWM0_GARVA|nr:hypothetical protein [Gardnerella vaginalis]PNS43939.1 hypothetical protein BFS05_01680 [Gardnerella vaginalis]
MEQFNQNGSNDIDNYESNEQNQTNPNNDNGLHDQGESVAVNNSVNNSANNSNGNDRYQQNQPSQNQPSQNQPSQNQQYQQNQYQPSQYAQNQNWYGQYPNQYQNSQYQNSQYYNNREYVNNQYNQNANNFSAQYPYNYTVNSNGTGSYSSDYVKQSAPYNAMNADSSYSSDSTSVKVNSSNFNLKSLLTKRNKIIAAVVCLSILLCVVVALCVPQKHNNSKRAATASSQSDSHKHSSADVKTEPKRQENPDAVDAGGPADYSALPLNQIYDQNWYKVGSELVATPGYTNNHNVVGMDVDAPVNDHDGFYNFYNARYKIDSAAEKGQIGKVIRSEISNSDADDDAIMEYYRVASDKRGTLPKLTTAQRNYLEGWNSVTDNFNKYTRESLYSGRISIDKMMSATITTTYNSRHPGSVGYADMYQSNERETNVPYVDENGDSIEFKKSAHYDSIMSVARWMMYDQGFYNVHASPAGAWGTCRLDNRGYVEAVQIVIPSQDKPDKFDVMVGVLDDIYFNRVLSRDIYYHVADYSGTDDYALYASVLRQSNKSTGILPFRAILHDVDRPLRAKDNELPRVMKKFGINDNEIGRIVGNSFNTLIGSNMFVDNEIRDEGYGEYTHRGDVEALPHYKQYVGSGNWAVYLNGLNAHSSEGVDDVTRYRAFVVKTAPVNRRWYGQPRRRIDYDDAMSNYDEFVKHDRAVFGN